MTIDSIAVAILLSISNLLGVPAVTKSLDGWELVSSWSNENGIYKFEANSAQIIENCRNHPTDAISFPSVIHAAHRIELDHRLLEQFGDPTFKRSRSFYGSPVIPCQDVVNGKLLSWKVFSQSKYFSRIIRFPKISGYENLQNAFSEAANVAGAGALFLFEFLILLLFWGRVPKLLALSLLGSVFFLIGYFVFTVAGFFSLPVSMLLAHKIADFSVCTGVSLLCCTLSCQKLLSWRVAKMIGGVTALSVLVMLLANSEDGVQLGTTMPLPFILIALAIATFTSFRKLVRESSGRRGFLESASLAIFVGSLFNDVFLVVGLREGPSLFSLGLIFGLSFFLVALNEYVISVFRERDDLKLRELRHVKEAEYALLARQVSHDIRSPLAALNMALKGLGNASSEVYVISKIAIDRIQYIANTLLEKGKGIEKHRSSSEVSGQTSGTEASRVEFIPALVEELIAEKRMQLRDRVGLSVDVQFDGSIETMYASVQPNELKRIFSNLLNNASESIESSGSIRITLKNEADRIVIRVVDDGKGIPQDVLPSLMAEGKTFGKVNGNGLGLSHAKKSIELWGGSIRLESILGKGTTVVLSIPRAEIPQWTVSEITINSSNVIVILDDDVSFHQVWKNRLRAYAVTEGKIPELVHCFKEDDLQTWFSDGHHREKTLFLLEYELRTGNSNGLDLIERLGIAASSILVTSHFDEAVVQQRCMKLEVRMIPKAIAGYVPIRFVSK